jgi:hypothetical protein
MVDPSIATQAQYIEHGNTLFGEGRVDIGSGPGIPDQTGDKAGTLFGVFLPCSQNILGIIIFLRLPWVLPPVSHTISWSK